MIKIVLVDDHEVVRRCIGSILEQQEDFELIGEAWDGESFFELLKSDITPDLVLTDLKMPGSSGLDIVEELRSAYPQTKSMILSSEDHEMYVSRALNAGASGYLLKNVSQDELLFAIRQVVVNKKYICSELADNMVNRGNHFLL